MKTIIINGTKVFVGGDEEFTYEDICNIAHPPQYTVTFCRGPVEKPEGLLSYGQKIKVVDGMIIDCMFTGNA